MTDDELISELHSKLARVRELIAAEPNEQQRAALRRRLVELLQNTIRRLNPN